jgi:uncharacterized protein (DUF983 family)
MKVMLMEKPTSIERIERMRNGEKVKCPKCADGFISAVGEPSTAHVFKCDGCGTSMVMKKEIDFKEYGLITN